MPEQDQFPDAPFPVRGVDQQTGHEEQTDLTTTTGKNIRVYETLTGRGRGGSRPGLKKFLDDRTAGSVVQHLNYIVDPQSTFLLYDEDFFEPEFLIDDPSTNNLRIRNTRLPFPNSATPGPVRRVRRRGSGVRVNIRARQADVTINWSNPADIGVGTALSGTQLNATATSGILSVPGTFEYTPPSGTVLAAGDTRPLRVVFTPTDEGFYKTARKTVYINVVKTTPIIVWADPASITSSTPLSATQLNAVAKHPDTLVVIPGSYVYTPPSGTLLSVGDDQVLSVVFTPTDTVSYNNANDTAIIDVTEGDSVEPDEFVSALVTAAGAPVTGEGASITIVLETAGTLMVTGDPDPGTVALPDDPFTWPFVPDDGVPAIPGGSYPQAALARQVSGSWYYYIPEI